LVNHPPACYLTARAQINDVSGIVLLDTGSGVTIISPGHWKIIGASAPIRPYVGPGILGPDGSSIGPEDLVTVKITMAGTTVQHPAIFARNFHHLILLGNDYMKSIGLVVDLQANKMWRRDHSALTYSVSSDLTEAGRMDVLVTSTERRIIAPYHIAYVHVHIPSSLSAQPWDASITSHQPHIATANSLIRFHDRKSFVQIANCSPHRQHVNLYCGQHLALADLYLGDSDSSAHASPLSRFLTLSSSSTSSCDPQLPSSNGVSVLPLSLADHSSSLSHLSSTSSTLPIDASSNISTVPFLQRLRLDDTHLDDTELVQLKTLLLKYQACFRDTPGHTSLTQHHIDTGSTNR
jgi:hypothetical protein